MDEFLKNAFDQTCFRCCDWFSEEKYQIQRIHACAVWIAPCIIMITCPEKNHYLRSKHQSYSISMAGSSLLLLSNSLVFLSLSKSQLVYSYTYWCLRFHWYFCTSANLDINNSIHYKRNYYSSFHIVKGRYRYINTFNWLFLTFLK